MSDIQVGGGAISLGNAITLIAVAALIWFGATVTSDHDAIGSIKSDTRLIVQSEASNAKQIADLTDMVKVFQVDQAEIRARLDCIQQVGSTQACPIKHRP